MPKMKSHSGAAKRFTKTGSGRIKRKSAFKSHILTKMSAKRKRQLRRPGAISEQDTPRVERMLANR